MLHEFLTAHRTELIARCKDKVAKRLAPPQISLALDHGVPLFLQQLVETLRLEEHTPAAGTVDTVPAPAPTEIGRAAAVHGAELLRLGYTVDQVVHDYGDVCQSVTELAGEHEQPITTAEFRTLNRCLDNAIADAVTSFGRANKLLHDGQTETLQQRLNYYSIEHRRLVDIAFQTFNIVKIGHVGASGTTSTVLLKTLEELRTLADRTLPEIRGV